MQSFGGDDDDRESGGGSLEGSSDNEQEGNQADREDPEIDGDGEAEADGDLDEDNEDEEEEEDEEGEEDDDEQEESQDSFGDAPHRGPSKRSGDSQSSRIGRLETVNGLSSGRGPIGSAPTSHPSSSALMPLLDAQGSPILEGHNHAIPNPRPETLTAAVYDIVPTIAAPHSTSINSITATPDLRWVFTGGSDGYIRKFNWVETANGKSMLTVAQRHPFVDSVTKAGVLMSYWENNEDSNPKAADDSSVISSVYSLAVQHEALWLLSGLESGGVNLQSVRHDEGKQIHCLRGHSSAVSVLTLASDEKSVLSGSWDRNVINWDLNTGKMIRNFAGSGGQISALAARPASSIPVPSDSGDFSDTKATFSSDGATIPRVNGAGDGLLGQDSQINLKAGDTKDESNPASPNDSLFGGNDADSLFGDGDDMNAAVPSAAHFADDEDDEFGMAIANGIREQENGAEQEQTHQIMDGETDVDMIDVGEPIDATTNARDTGEKDELMHEQSKNVLEQEIDNISIAQLPKSNSDLEPPSSTDDTVSGPALSEPQEATSNVDSTFLAASIDGSIRIWDKRQPRPVAQMTPQNVPPWCMNACWSADGNFIYAGRRNGTVDEYSLHKGLRGPERSFKLPNNSGAVSAVRAMPNGRHLICASYDILRLYDLQEQQIFKHATVPFLIVPGHRTGVVSQLYIDSACRYLISTAGNRGWEGSNTEVLLGYEIGVPPQH